ncbi:MAG: phosphate ABC transporter substrate-binding protein PstS [Nitrososphaerales archaeon]
MAANKAVYASVVIIILALAVVYLAFLQMGQQTETQTVTVTQKVSATTQPTTTSAPTISLNGAGATFPYPLISTMVVEYNKIKPNVKISYQSIGSGGGIRQHTEKTVDFGASDSPLNEKQREAAPNTLHIPITIGSVVLAYNLPGFTKGLKMTGEVVADIFLGKITKWNDPAIQSINPDLNLPNKDILVAHRSDGSGTTFVWTGYLSIVSPEWKSKVGQGTAVQWPIGLGAAGNEGVAAVIRGTEYTVGYVELAYALQNKMSYAYLQNKEGRFIEPTLSTSAAAAAASATILPRGDESWSSVSLLNAPGANSYPVTSFSYILLYKDLSTLPTMNKDKAQALIDFLWWAIHDGQKYAPDLQYVPLPQEVVALNEATLRMVTFEGQPLIR